jgi:chemotaxis signal transduction protein
MPFQGVKRDSRFIIVRNQEMKVGLMVDKVVGIFSLDTAETQIQETPYRNIESNAGVSAYISGVLATEDGLLNFLDTDKLLASPRMNAFRGD